MPDAAGDTPPAKNCGQSAKCAAAEEGGVDWAVLSAWPSYGRLKAAAGGLKGNNSCGDKRDTEATDECRREGLR